MGRWLRLAGPGHHPPPGESRQQRTGAGSDGSCPFVDLFWHGHHFLDFVLITRTRGFAALGSGGEWGGIVISCIVIAIALLGIGDSGLRPAVRHLAATGDGRRPRRFAWIGFILTLLAIGFMTRALYASF